MNDTISQYIGPSYNYADNVIDPAQLGIKKTTKKKPMEQLFKDIGGLAAYTDTLAFGKNTMSKAFGVKKKIRPLGNKFFIKSGTCGDESVKECRGKDRYIYIDNVPSGKIPCLKQLGIKLPSTSFKGLVPGLIEDLAYINPVAIFNSLAGKGGISDKCYLRTEKVGYSGNPSKYQTVTQCAPKDVGVQCLPNLFDKETFQNYQSQQNKKNNKLLIVIIILFIIIILLIIFNKSLF